MRHHIILGIFLYIFTMMTGTGHAETPNLNELFIRSIGGQSALEALKTYTGYSATGKISMNSMQGEFQVDFQKPDRYRLVLKFGPMALAQGYDGSTAWSTDMNGKTTVLEGMEKQELMKNIYFETYDYLLNPEKAATYAYLFDTTAESTVYHVIQFYPTPVDTVVCWYNRETGLKMKQISKMDAFEVITYTDEYKKIDNFLFPYKSRAVMPAANSTIVSNIDTVLFNPDFPQDHFTMPGVQPKDFHFPPGQTQVTIPMEYFAGHIRLNITINGKSYMVILDSGASTNVFHLPAMEEHQFAAVGSLPAMGVGGFDEITLYKTDSINIGDLTLYGLVAGAMDLSSLFAGFAKDENFGGILGYDFLARFPLLIDYEAETITLYNPDNFTPDSGGMSLEFFQTMLIPTISAEINGVQGNFVVDLGNSFGLILNPKFVEDNQLEQTFSDVKENKVSISGVGGQLPGKNGIADSFVMGDIRINGLRVLLPDSSPGMTGMNSLAGNIGNLILNRFKVLLDYSRNLIVLYPLDA